MVDTTNLYFYKALVTKVVDGDTIYADINGGFHVTRKEILRLANINAPELKTGKPGQEAKSYLVERLLGKEVLIRTYKSDSFGRYLARIWVDGVEINTELVEKGYAVAYLEHKAGV